MNQSTVRTAVIVMLAALGVVTVIAFIQEGFTVFSAITASWWSLQIFLDLVIALVLFLVWLYRDAKASGRDPWPWIVATFVVGSFAPLFYLLLRDSAEG